jgi:hypothetical protein
MDGAIVNPALLPPPEPAAAIPAELKAS